MPNSNEIRIPANDNEPMYKDLYWFLNESLTEYSIEKSGVLSAHNLFNILSPESLDDLMEAFNKREDGGFRIMDGIPQARISLENKGESPLIYEFSKPMPYMGRMTMTISEEWKSVLSKENDERIFMKMNQGSLIISFSHPELADDMEIDAIALTQTDLRIYTIDPTNGNKLQIILDFNLQKSKEEIIADSVETLGAKIGMMICTDRCMCGGGNPDNNWRYTKFGFYCRNGQCNCEPNN